MGYLVVRWEGIDIDVLGSLLCGIGVAEDGMEWDGIRDRIELELELDMGRRCSQLRICVRRLEGDTYMPSAHILFFTN